MGAHRELAVAAMKIRSQRSLQSDFMAKAGFPLPEVHVNGALPASLRQEVPAQEMKMLVDMIMVFSIGDYGPDDADWSTYYNPESPWYNVFYGSYALRSHKLDGSAWGFDHCGNPDFDEFMRVPAIDYNFFTAGQFGCPPQKMCFEVTKTTPLRVVRHPWHAIDVEAKVPSGLHDPVTMLGKPKTYVLYGVPRRSFLDGRESFEELTMSGRMYMARIPDDAHPLEEPLTLAFGALCLATPEGQKLLHTITDALATKYLPLI